MVLQALFLGGDFCSFPFPPLLRLGVRADLHDQITPYHAYGEKRKGISLPVAHRKAVGWAVQVGGVAISKHTTGGALELPRALCFFNFSSTFVTIITAIGHRLLRLAWSAALFINMIARALPTKRDARHTRRRRTPSWYLQHSSSSSGALHCVQLYPLDAQR